MLPCPWACAPKPSPGSLASTDSLTSILLGLFKAPCLTFGVRARISLGTEQRGELLPCDFSASRIRVLLRLCGPLMLGIPKSLLPS
jgi:hypothetical protein